METHKFKNSAEFFTWAKRIVKDKDPAYDRVPVGKQTWTYGDGHMAETTWGQRKGTMLSNLSYMIQTATGKLYAPRDAMLVNDIDARGGVILTVDWGVETHEFKNSAEFFNWAKRIVKDKDPAYNRAPVGKQTWTYGDGHMAKTTWGQRKGTMLSNLSYILKIIDGKLDGPRDAMLVNDIDARGGVILTVDWGE